MKMLNHQLTLLDEQLEAYEPLTRWLILTALCIGILYISWMFFTAEKLQELRALQDQRGVLETKITQNSPEAYQLKIERLNATRLKKERSITELKEKKQFLFNQMSNTKGLLFDNRHYAKMLDSLLERSVQLGLKIERMDSIKNNDVFFGKVKQLKTLTIVGTGKFPAIATFLSFAEDQNALVQIKSVEIRSDQENPRFTAVLIYMGVEL